MTPRHTRGFYAGLSPTAPGSGERGCACFRWLSGQDLGRPVEVASGGDAQGGRQPLLWGEPPGFGGVGGTLPPRLSPGGGNGKGGVKNSLLPQAIAYALRLNPASRVRSRRILTATRKPPTPFSQTCQGGFPLSRHRPCTAWPADPQNTQQNRRTLEIPAHSPKIFAPSLVRDLERSGLRCAGCFFRRTSS